MDDKILDIQTIRRYVSDRKIYWTEHCLSRMDKRNIIITAYYPDKEEWEEDMITRRNQ